MLTRSIEKSLILAALAAVILICLTDNVVAQNALTIPTNPTAAYIHINQDPQATDTVPINLQALGIAEGDTIQLQSLGSYSPYTGCSLCIPPIPGVPETATSMIGVFSSTSTLLPSTFLNRVPDAIDAGVAPFFTPFTLYGNQFTDIPQDFFISSSVPLTVQVPLGAKYLFVAANDGFYGDNGDADG